MPRRIDRDTDAPRCRDTLEEEDSKMNLEIHRPELVQRVNAHIQTGHFHNADEVIEKALDALDEKAPAPMSPAQAGTGQDLIDACARVRGLLADEEVDTIFSRNKSGARPVNFE
jgi:Arc/MetJ-type ribon-helix-helix transcriptional regulator